MFIRGQVYLISVSAPMMLVMVDNLGKEAARTGAKILAALNKLTRTLVIVLVETISFDGEKCLASASRR